MFSHLANLYRLHLVPTVKRLCTRRHLIYTVLTTGVLWVSAATLSLLIFHTAQRMTACEELEREFAAYLNTLSATGVQLPDVMGILAAARAEGLVTAVLGGCLWLLLSVFAVGLVMKRVIEAEAYVYGLYIICGSDRKQLRRQLLSEFLLLGTLALALGIPVGFFLAPKGTGFHPIALAVILLCFLVLLLLGARVLAGQILNRPCLKMLDAADVTEYTVSPRRSVFWGLTKRRGPFASAALSLWRMRKHFITLSLTLAVIAALVFSALTPVGQPLVASSSTFALHISSGLTYAELDEKILFPLAENDSGYALDYTIRNSAEALGTHVLVRESASGGEEVSVALGARYATDSIRIACGDGDTSYELGGAITIPPEHAGKRLPTKLGYDLDGVPVGGATYAVPEDGPRSLDLKVGDTVRLYLPSDGDATMAERAETDQNYISVRITKVETIPNIKDLDTGETICPRVTEDILYLNPLDFGLFDGKTYAVPFTTEDARMEDFFESDDENTCVLVVPEGYFAAQKAPQCVTVIAPTDVVKIPFHDGSAKLSLPDDTYFINLTARGVGVYLGDEGEFLSHPDAENVLREKVRQRLSSFKESKLTPVTRTEYAVERIIYTERGGEPYILLRNDESRYYSSKPGDVCALRMADIDEDIPSLKIIADEAYLTEIERPFSASLFRHRCFLGISLLPDFRKAMETQGMELQFSDDWFRHADCLVRNSFSFNTKAYLLAEHTPPEKSEVGYLQGNEYPRFLTGTGNFVTLGNISAPSIRSIEGTGAFALFTHDSIGSLKNESVELESLYARNDWIISPDCEVLPGTSLETGHAVFITDSDPADCPIRVGETLSVAIRADTSSLADDLSFFGLTGIPLLARLLDELDYRYLYVKVDRVVQGSTSELVLAETDLASVLGQSGAYADLDVYLPETASLEEYLDMYRTLYALTASVGGPSVLTENKDFITASRLDGSHNAVTLRRMGYLSIILIPLLALAAQSVFEDKRRSEYGIRHALGQTSRHRFAQNTAETLLTALLTTMAAAVLCPLGYVGTLALADAMGAAITLSSFNIPLYIALLGLTFISVIIACAIRKPIRQNHTQYIQNTAERNSL